MHCSSMCDSGSLLKPLELGKLWIFLYFLVPKKPRLFFALGNQLSLFHARWTLLIKFLKTRRLGAGEARVEDMVKGVIGALPVGREGEMVHHSYRTGLKINPCRDLCNTRQGLVSHPVRGTGHTAPCLSRERALGDMLCKEVIWSTCSNHGPWGKKRARGEVGGYSSAVTH